MLLVLLLLALPFVILLFSGFRTPCVGYFEELIVLVSDDIWEYFCSWETAVFDTF